MRKNLLRESSNHMNQIANRMSARLTSDANSLSEQTLLSSDAENALVINRTFGGFEKCRFTIVDSSSVGGDKAPILQGHRAEIGGGACLYFIAWVKGASSPTTRTLTIDWGSSSESQTESSNFLAMLSRIARLENERAAVRYVYKCFYALRMTENYPVANKILGDLDPDRFAPVVLIAILTITAPLKDRLEKRVGFFAEVKQSLERRHGTETTQSLLLGLE